ncbi:ABC transporter substrate-binding protein [Macrococcus capreoli]
MNMKKLSLLFISVFVFILVLTGCQNSSSTKETSKDSSTESTKDSNSQSNGDTKSNKTDKLVLYAAGPDNMVEAMVKDFEKKQGVKVEVFSGTTGEILGRLEAEKNNPKADIVQVASLPAAMDYKEKGLIMPYKVKNHDKLYKDWVDAEGYYYGFSGSALGISYNTEQVKNAPKDWSDLTKPEFKDKIAIPDPSQSGTAIDLLSINVKNNEDKAWDLYKQLKDNGIKMAGANKPALETVIKGQNAAVFGGVDYMVYAAKKKGEPVDIAFPESGTAISPRPAFILKSAKNVENAKAYMEYVTGADGQKQVDSFFLMPADKSFAKNKEGVKREDIKELKYDWKNLSKESETVLKKYMDMMR